MERVNGIEPSFRRVRAKEFNHGFGKIPTREQSKITCWTGYCWVKAKERNNSPSVLTGWAVPILFPFFDRSVRYPKFEQLSELGHG